MELTGKKRWRPLAVLAANTIVLFGLAACAQEYPNTTFSPHTDFGRDIDKLWNLLLYLGTAVFILVEGALIVVVIKYRHRGGDQKPPQTHGNTTLEILWTLIPAVILVFIAVPTVKTIFKTQAPPPSGALNIEVTGHQWWWEFKYPEYGVTTANEIYVPIGRTVSFSLTSADVIHSFWTPQMGGKRDVIANRINHIWYTPDATMQSSIWNGFCAEYCGTSHANMRFRVFTVKPDEFAGWVAGQKAMAAYGATAPAAPATSPTPVATVTAAAPAYVFPRDKIPSWAIPHSPLPAGLTFNKSLVGDPARGQQLYSSNACIGCHTISGNPMSVGIIGPNLTHIASRSTIAAGRFPNDTEHLSLWIKNARMMKPGVTMPTLGKDQFDPQLKAKMTSGLDDQQIADIVAYLQALK